MGSEDVAVRPRDTDNIDIEKLRAKYSGDRNQLREDYEAAARMKQSNVPANMDLGMGKDLPNPVVMCQACQALGTIKKQYGYRVMEEVCERCGGEGMIIQKPKVASEELLEKVARVEALIGEADSLEELERLEEALKERTINALDAVLEPATTGSEPQ